MKTDVPECIGGDILFYDGETPEVIMRLRPRRRFLDVLWLPCPLGQLNPEQIGIISRFREDRIERDGQFGHAKFARKIIGMLLRVQKLSQVIEVGCGKFPIAKDVAVQRYCGIEIDRVAINYCQQLGFDVRVLSDFSDDDVEKYEAAIATYAFHFAISERLIAMIDRSLKAEGYLGRELINQQPQ